MLVPGASSVMQRMHQFSREWLTLALLQHMHVCLQASGG